MSRLVSTSNDMSLASHLPVTTGLLVENVAEEQLTVNNDKQSQSNSRQITIHNQQSIYLLLINSQQLAINNQLFSERLSCGNWVQGGQFSVSPLFICVEVAQDTAVAGYFDVFLSESQHQAGWEESHPTVQSGADDSVPASWRTGSLLFLF